MRRERVARFFDRFHERVTEFLVAKMLAHSVRQALPELFAALLVDRGIADHRKLVGPRRDEDEDGVAFRSLMHAEPVEFLLGGDQWIDI